MSERYREILSAAWADLRTHTPRQREFRTKRIEGVVEFPVYAALRAADDAPCLVAEVAVSASVPFEVGGMRLAPYAAGPGALLVLSLEDREALELFETVSADALETATAAAPSRALKDFLARLEAWRRFLRERRSGLSRPELVGLLGELLILERLVSRDAGMLSAWTAPDDGLHDFFHVGHALEVKTSLGASSAIRISKLDQLSTDGLRRLELLHVRLVEDPDGRSLHSVICAIEALLSEPDRRVFANMLLRRGLMPDDSTARHGLRSVLQSLAAFMVADDFPRLTPSTVPGGISDASYAVELWAISRHSCDVNAVLTEFRGGGQP